MTRLRQMSLFAHVVESGSISAAAEQLDLSKSVVSQHLKNLEADLDLVLLKRTTRQQQLTSAGAAFYEQCRAINQLADDAWQQAQNQQQQPHGKVRITAPHALMEYIVAPAIGKLLVQYPRLEIELLAGDQRLDLLQEPIDLAVRVGQSRENSLRQRRIGEFRDVLCGHAELITQGPPQSLPYIANHWQGPTIRHRLKHIENGRETQLTFQPRCRADALHTCLALLNDGAGIGLLPDFVMRQHPKLQPVSAEHRLAAENVYILHAYQDKLPLRLQISIEAIEKAFEQKTALP